MVIQTLYTLTMFLECIQKMNIFPGEVPRPAFFISVNRGRLLNRSQTVEKSSGTVEGVL